MYDQQVKLAKIKVYSFLYDFTKKVQFKLKTKQYLDNVKKIIQKFEVLHINAKERFEIVKKGCQEEKNRVLIKMARSKNKKLKEQIGKISKFQEHNVIQRYMRYIQDQHAMEFTMWRKRVADLDLNAKEMKAFRLRISVIRTTVMKNQKEDQNELVNLYGPQIDTIIPCLDPDVAMNKNIQDEDMMTRYLNTEKIFDLDQEME